MLLGEENNPEGCFRSRQHNLPQANILHSATSFTNIILQLQKKSVKMLSEIPRMDNMICPNFLNFPNFPILLSISIFSRYILLRDMVKDATHHPDYKVKQFYQTNMDGQRYSFKCCSCGHSGQEKLKPRKNNYFQRKK